MSRAREGYKALEEQVIDETGAAIERVSDADVEVYDAETVAMITSTSRLPVIGQALVPRGAPVEIKTCVRWFETSYQNGDRRRGRFQLTRSSHRELAERDGWYLLAVRNDDDHVLAAILIADELEPLLRWRATESEPYRNARACLRWADVIPRERVASRAAEGALEEGPA